MPMPDSLTLETAAAWMMSLIRDGAAVDSKSPKAANEFSWTRGAGLPGEVDESLSPLGCSSSPEL